MFIIIILIIILILILYNRNVKIFTKSDKNNISVDFVTITYNNPIEMNLLKLQAYSMKYVDKNFINKIIIIYNDTGDYDFTDIINCYPEELQNKVMIVDAIKLIPNYDTSSWHNQQFCKLLIANIVESKYYLILDGKNHFIKNITRSDYFYSNKPKLFLDNPGQLIERYYNCLKYFNIECPYNFNKNCTNILLTTTPFLMSKKDVIDMMKMIETKENMSFIDFFKSNLDIITEFYIYTTYLIYTNRISNYKLCPKNYTYIVNDPYDKWNTFDIHQKTLNKPHIKIFGLHRKALSSMNNNYKLKLRDMYKKYYSDNICQFINKNILQI